MKEVLTLLLMRGCRRGWPRLRSQIEVATPAPGFTRSVRRGIVAALAACVAGVVMRPLAADAQQAVPAPAGASAAIPTPGEFHGFDISERYIITDKVLEYYKVLADRSPRVEYSEYGQSIQGRPLPMLMIGNEDVLARKGEIEAQIRQLTNVTERLPAAEVDRLIADLPAIVWIFIVDTDEEAGVNVLQEVAHDLATREDALARSIRENTLVIMTPLTNPDSHARYVTWHMLYDVDGASVDRNAIENRAHWGMNTDGNAYGIDVNRDFAVFVSPEMRALARIVTQWHPQFWLDIHSGPNVIFMPPFPRPWHPLWPDSASRWWNAFAHQASDNFGKKGWTFNSREGYEGVTHPSFGLSWGMLNSAVSGLLFETFGGRPGKTTSFVRDDGTIATMRMAMDRHYEGIWSLLQVASDQRQLLLRDAHGTVVGAVDRARKNAERAVVLPVSGPGVDPDKVERLVSRLVLQGVEVKRASRDFSARARDFFSDQVAAQQFGAGSYIIDFVQPHARLAMALMDPTIDYSNPQVEVPYRRKAPYYDSSWGNLALVFGVPAYALSGAVTVASEPVTEEQLAQTRQSRASIQSLDRVELPYAYLLPPGREASMRVAIALLREGYKLRAFQAPFSIRGRRFEQGTWAALAQRNPATLRERIQALAKQHGSDLVEVAGPFTDAGVTFGDESRLVAIAKPLVAVVADWPVAHDHTYGGIRNTLEADFGFAFSPVMLATINNADLSKYTAVVLPHAGMDIRGGPGFEKGYKGLLNLPRLREYVQKGGTLVVVKGAAEALLADSGFGKDVKLAGWAEHTSGATLRAQWTIPEVASAVSDSALATWRPGLSEVFKPVLAAGYERQEFAAPGTYPVLLSVSEGGAARIVASYSDDPRKLLLDGFMLDSDREALAGKPFVVEQHMGRGRVIYFADDPTFRGYWYGLNSLFLNALMLPPAAGSGS